jgi:hypothetical protein
MTNALNLLPKWGDVDRYIQQLQPFLIPACSLPWASVSFSPASGKLQLFVETQDRFDELQPPIDMSIEAANQDNRSGSIISTTRSDLYHHFYSFANIVIDAMVADGLTPTSAFERAIDSLQELIQRATLLSDQKQIGIMAELLVLLELAKHRPWKWCLDAWHDELNAEHDFNLGTVDLEVKATLMEARTHQIGSVYQLKRSDRRNLFLASFQFTKDQHPGSVRLPSLVDAATVGASEEDRSLVDRLMVRLHKLGYRPESAAHYRLGLAHRAAPSVFLVDDAFPKLVPTAISGLPAEILSRISDVSYRINLDGLTGSSLERFVEAQCGDTANDN